MSDELTYVLLNIATLLASVKTVHAFLEFDVNLNVNISCLEKHRLVNETISSSSQLLQIPELISWV